MRMLAALDARAISNMQAEAQVGFTCFKSAVNSCDGSWPVVGQMQEGIMALGKRCRKREMEAFGAATELPKSPGNPFYTALQRLLAVNGFDALVEKLCAPHYAGLKRRLIVVV